MNNEINSALIELNKITTDLNLPPKTKISAQIIFSRTLKLLKTINEKFLSIQSIHISCKLNEIPINLSTILNYFKCKYNLQEISLNLMTEVEIDILKILNFDVDFEPIHLIYLNFLKVLEVQSVSLKVLNLLDEIHLNEKIYKIAYFKDGIYKKADIALAMLGDKQIEKFKIKFKKKIRMEKIVEIRKMVDESYGT